MQPRASRHTESDCLWTLTSGTGVSSATSSAHACTNTHHVSLQHTIIFSYYLFPFLNSMDKGIMARETTQDLADT
jgi:hypothetical protein